MMTINIFKSEAKKNPPTCGQEVFFLFNIESKKNPPHPARLKGFFLLQKVTNDCMTNTNINNLTTTIEKSDCNLTTKRKN